MRIVRVLRYRAYCCLLTGLLIGTVGDGSTAPSGPVEHVAPALRESVDATVRQILARTGVPSASVALVRDQRLIYAQAYGSATLEPRRAALPSMRYPVGSISKEFTAAALLDAEQR